MTTRRTGKYSYNAICDICGFKKKSSELRLRWDGFMVCDEDWEPRNILDFYRTRNDAHLLPFTRPDVPGENTWTPTPTNITGTFTTVASWIEDTTTKVITYRVEIIPTTGVVVGTGSNLLAPSSFQVSTDRQGTAFINNGKYVGGITITTFGTTNIFLPNFSISASPLQTLLICGSFINTV